MHWSQQFPQGLRRAGGAPRTSQGAPGCPRPSAQQQPCPQRSSAPGQPALPGHGSSCQPRTQPAAELPQTRRRLAAVPGAAPGPGDERVPRGERWLPPGAPPPTSVATRAAAPLRPAPPGVPRLRRWHRAGPVPRVPVRRPLAGWAPGEEARESAVPGGTGPPPAPPAGHPRDGTGPDGREDAASSRPAPSPRGGGRRRTRPSAPGRSRRSAPPPCCRRGGPGEPRSERGMAVAAAGRDGGALSAPRPCRAPEAAGKRWPRRGGSAARCSPPPRREGAALCLVWVCCPFFGLFFKLMGHN